MRRGSFDNFPHQPAVGSDSETPPIVIDWRTEVITKLFLLFIVPAVIVLLAWMAGKDWRLAALLAVPWVLITSLGTHPHVLLSLVQMHRDRLAARVRLEEIEARKLVDLHASRMQRDAELARAEHYGLLLDQHDRQIALKAQGVSGLLPVVDPLEDFLMHCLMDAYREAAPDGLVPAGIISRARTKAAGYSEGQHAEIVRRLQDSGVARFERQRWYLNLDRYPSFERAFEALTGRRWVGGAVEWWGRQPTDGDGLASFQGGGHEQVG